MNSRRVAVVVKVPLQDLPAYAELRFEVSSAVEPEHVLCCSYQALESALDDILRDAR